MQLRIALECNRPVLEQWQPLKSICCLNMCLTAELLRPSLSSLPKDIESMSLSTSTSHAQRFVADIDYGDDYVQPLILEALSSRLPTGSFKLVDKEIEPGCTCLQIKQYEDISFEHLMSYPTTFLANSYIIRKALIRKHYLSTTAHNWLTKSPKSVLATSMKPSCEFELDYAEFLDDALVEAWELQESFQKNEEKEPEDREWWILKPGMSDRGQGIRLFSTQDELQAIFEEWEEGRPDSDDEEEEAAEDDTAESNGDYIMTSQLRHFVAQPYIDRPLLFPNNPRKFHIRTYVLCVGALKVYVYKPMLALFASNPYVAPWSTSTAEADLRAHLTNTCLQDGTREGAVQKFWDLPSVTATSSLPETWKDAVFSQICSITGEIFEAAAKGMMVHFQTLPNAFEVFGLDFLVDENGTAWLLEVNAFPDFKQTGPELKGLVKGLWEGVVDVAVAGFFAVQAAEEDEQTRTMVLVRELDLGRR